ncbi:MAG TPA: hypothetical protein VFL86_16635 [Burkholderiaceae bacterium]|nr:hypothetical protein [Burkholderiaceae bacterium]
MPIQFEEVTGEIAHEPTSAPAAPAPAAPARPSEDVASQIENTLRMLEERHARLCAD